MSHAKNPVHVPDWVVIKFVIRTQARIRAILSRGHTVEARRCVGSPAKDKSRMICVALALKIIF